MTDFGLKYINARGEEFDFFCEKAYYSECPIRDYEWSYDTSCGEVVRFFRDSRELSLPLTVVGSSDERDRMIEVFERDVAGLTPGKLFSGEWWVRCFVIGSSKPDSWSNGGSMTFSLKLLLVDASWTSERTVPFFPARAPSGYKYLDFPVGFPFDLSPNRAAERLENPFRAPSDFKLVVYGPAVNPYVIIGGNRYQVNVTVGDGGILTIDSRTAKCVLKSVDGVEQNVFSLRVKGDKMSNCYPFRKIPPGVSDLSWDNGFGFDLTLLGERSEPPWT